MLNFLKLEQKIDWTKEFLILGKGPSFSRRDEVNRFSYNTFGLNHVAEVCPVDFTNVIDLDVLSEKIIKNSKYVLMPWHPHIKNRSFTLNLQQLTIDNKWLQLLKRRHGSGKTLTYWYNLSTWKGAHKVNDGFAPIIRAKYFSVEAVMDILGMLGVKKIYTLGIDGGTEYAEEFSHLTPLTNRRKSFDDQSNVMTEIRRQYQMELVKL